MTPEEPKHDIEGLMAAVLIFGLLVPPIVLWLAIASMDMAGLFPALLRAEGE
jgi:hypothetical protein